MLAFNDLERAALKTFAELNEAECPGLAAQLAETRPIRRENTGGGFFTELEVDRRAVAPLSGSSPIGDYETVVDGMRHPLGLLLFHSGGYVELLEGYAIGGDDTSEIDFDLAKFGPLRASF